MSPSAALLHAERMNLGRVLTLLEVILNTQNTFSTKEMKCWVLCLYIDTYTVKPVKRPLRKRQAKDLSLMKVEIIAAILLTCIEQ